MPPHVTADDLRALATLQRLAIPPACEAGVLANMALFLHHAGIVAAVDDAAADPAELLRP